MTDFTRDALEQARELTPLGVELGLHDGDGCELLIGKHARIACHDGCKRYTLSLDGMPGYSYPFHTLEAAVRSASTVECVFASLREGSRISQLDRIANPNKYGDPTPREGAAVRQAAREALSEVSA